MDGADQIVRAIEKLSDDVGDEIKRVGDALEERRSLTDRVQALERLVDKLQVEQQRMSDGLKTQSGQWDVQAVQAAALQMVSAPRVPREERKRTTTIPPSVLWVAKLLGTPGGKAGLISAATLVANFVLHRILTR